MKNLNQFIFITAWLAGIYLSKGFWLTVLAILFPPYAWYLLVELAMKSAGIV